MFDEFDRLDEKPNKEIDTSYVAFTEEDYQELQRNLVLYKQGNAEAVTYIVNTFHRFINKYARFITYGSLPYIPYTDSKGNKRHKVDPSVSRFVALFIDKNTSAGQDKKKCFSNTCVLRNLEKEISQKGMNATLFKLCRNFYLLYPQIGATVSHQFELPDFEKSSTVSNEFMTKPDILVQSLSFSHIREIMVIADAFERFFYEIQCLQ